MPIWRSFVSETYARLATLWPDRFMTPVWRSRFVVTGLENLQACHATGRPVVLAVIRAQPLNLLRLRFWALWTAAGRAIFGRYGRSLRQLLDAFPTQHL